MKLDKPLTCLPANLQPLVNTLTESTVNQVAWQTFSQNLVQKYSLHVCHVLILNQETKSVRFHIDAGERLPPDVANEYVTKHIHGDQLIQALMHQPANQFYAVSRHPNKSLILQSEQYKKWVAPQGILESAGAKILSDDGWQGIILCNRHQSVGDFTDAELQELNLLLPHIQQAASLSFLEQHSAAENRLSAIVNTYRIPVAVLDEMGKICAINQEMTQLISSEDTLHIDSQCLRITDKKLDNLLYTSLMQTAKRVEGYEFFANKLEQVELNPQVFLGFQPLVRLLPDGREQFDGAMVYAISPNLIKPIESDKIAKLFGLTNKEAIICQHLAKGVPAKKIASLEDISANTVKFHLKNIFLKTGCTNQMSLVNMINSIPYY